ncbi:HNH endonuclease, partial [Halomonas meridiana]|nr:HNH endonuclease [Halomonas meridiana]
FQTGDMVRAIVPTGKKAGTYTGRVAVRKRGSFNIQRSAGTVSDISYKYCTLIQRSDGYGYYVTPFTNLTGGAGQAVA